MNNKDKNIIRRVVHNINPMYHMVNYDYGTATDCGANGCDSICRCGVITDVTITPFPNVEDEVAKSILRGLNSFKKDKPKISLDPTLAKFCLSRVFRNCGMRNVSNYDYSIGQGYYGQELHGITFCNHYQFDELVIDVLSCTSNVKAVKLALIAEYGYLTPEVEKCSKASVVDIDFEDIRVPNIDYPNRLDSETIALYQNTEYGYPIGIYKKDSDFYRLIDGYHRYYAIKNSKNVKKSVPIILLS